MAGTSWVRHVTIRDTWPHWWHSQSVQDCRGGDWHRRQNLLSVPQHGTLYSLGTAPGTFASNHLGIYCQSIVQIVLSAAT